MQLLMTYYSDDDKSCDDADGECNWLSDGCEGGNFMKGKCGGPDNRRCCVPNPDGKKYIYMTEIIEYSIKKLLFFIMSLC